ncbi:MAG: glutamate synthase [Provencibacterium sp.]|jgi:glutamate synthase domain-containing protein 3|nr:glutamate synthase [Provencibacterium sp.]
MQIDAAGKSFLQLNEEICACLKEQITITGCNGQRYIGDGLDKKKISVYGTAGNALGAYLCGGEIEVFGNAQDAVGDTMDSGRIVVHGRAGDAVGYAMRGGSIFIQGDIGYRAGIHMKQYQQKQPVLVAGGCAGSFLGEYQAGGTIVILNLKEETAAVGNFCAAGIHGGRIFLRQKEPPADLPQQVVARRAEGEDRQVLLPLMEEFERYFGRLKAPVDPGDFWVLTPNTKNPYRKLYTSNGG